MDRTQVRRKILTYALISANFSGRSDPVSALYPLLSPIASDNAGQPFNPTSFKLAMSEAYGMTLTRDVIELFAQRLTQLGLTRGSGDRAIWVAPKKNQFENIPNDDAALKRLLKQARKFHVLKSDLLTTEFNEDNFLEATLQIILNSHATVQQATQFTYNEDNTDGEVRIKNPDQYFASEFIKWTQENDKQTFEWIAALGGAAIVAEALVELRSPTLPSNVSADLTVYLDTPFLMELLGCSGKSAREDAKFIVDQLKIHRVSVSVLQHSINELTYNLKGVLKAEPHSRTGPSAQALLYQEVTEHYLKSVLDDPEYFINESGIFVVDVNKSGHLIDKSVFTDEDEQNFFANILTAYKHNEAAVKDAASVAWIMRRRKGEDSRDVLKSKHVLLTRNQLIYRKINTFCLQRKYIREDRVGPVILARDLAGVLWLLGGAGERSQISQRQLLLNCQRAQANAPEVINYMINLLKGVNSASADLFMAAVNKPAYLSLALDTVAGMGSGVTAQVAEDTLQRIRNDLIADERSKSKATLQKTKEKYETDGNLKEIIMGSLNKNIGELSEENIRHMEAWRDLSRREWLRQSSKARTSLIQWTFTMNAIVILVSILGVIVGADIFKIGNVLKATIGSVLFISSFFITFILSENIIRKLVEQQGQKTYSAWLVLNIPDQARDDATVDSTMLVGSVIDIAKALLSNQGTQHKPKVE